MSNANITVIGAGLMGHGIAQVFALAGHDVTLYDSFEQTLASAKERIRANLGIDWSLKEWGATWQMRYYGAFRDECWDETECNQPNYQSPNWAYGVGANRKGASVYHDVQLRYSLPWNGTVSFGVRNLFDKTPTITYLVNTSSTAKLDPTLDIDRYFYLQYTQKF